MNVEINSGDKEVSIRFKEKIFSSILDHGELKDKIDGLVDTGHKFIKFDMEAVDFIDSTGIGQIFALHKRLQEEEGKLTIINLHPRIHKVLKMMEIDDMLLE